MSIFFPYNEILPKRRAHAIYLFYSAFFFAKQGYPSVLIYGGKKKNIKQIRDFYQLPDEKMLSLQPIFHIRKNNLFNLSWNAPFFFLCQNKIEKEKPNVVITSVRKQANYHIKRKVANVRYIYEVHELCTYPGQQVTEETLQEKKMLQNHDLIITTTHQLKKLLREKPYSLSNPIEVVPLASHAKALPLPSFSSELKLFYIGSFNPEQRVEMLLEALKYTKKTHLTLIGGTEAQISYLQNQSYKLGIEKKLEFLGFQQPAKLQSLVEQADAFVAPFDNQGKMAYVAHTKLADYTAWGRPLIAPDLPIVKEHVDPHTFFYQNEKIESLVDALQKLESPQQREAWHAKKARFDLSWDTRTHNYLQILQQKKFI